MRTQGQSSLVCQIIIALLILIGCASPIPTVQQTTAKTPSPSVTPIISPTVTPPIWATFLSPAPTMLPDQELAMVELLQSKDCALPCYLGIIPGKTIVSEAKTILENIGGSYLSYYIRNTDNAIYYTYQMRGGDPSGINETPEPDGRTAIIYHDVSLITNNDIVQIIEVRIAVTLSVEKYRNVWSRYSARNIFLQLGRPDELLTNSFHYPEGYAPLRDSTLLIVYQKLGVVVGLHGWKEENNICPEYESNDIHLNLSLFNPDSSLSIYSDRRVHPTNRDVWLPVKESVVDKLK